MDNVESWHDSLTSKSPISPHYNPRDVEHLHKKNTDLDQMSADFKKSINHEFKKSRFQEFKISKENSFKFKDTK